MRLSLTRLSLIVAFAATGCREPTSPERTLGLVVAPTVLRIDPGSGFVQVTYTIRNLTPTKLLTSASPDIQAQSTSGGWTTIGDPNAIYIASTLAVVMPANVEQQQGKFDKLAPGRYRLRATYWRLDPVTEYIVGEPGEAISNEFVVAP